MPLVLVTAPLFLAGDVVGILSAEAAVRLVLGSATATLVASMAIPEGES